VDHCHWRWCDHPCHDLQVPKLEIDYGYSGMLPETDSVSIKLIEFNKIFGEEGGLFLFGFQDPDFFTVDNSNSFNKLKKSIRGYQGNQQCIICLRSHQYPKK